MQQQSDPTPTRNLLAACLCLILFASGCGVAISGTVAESVFEQSLNGRTMGTTYSVKCWSKTSLDGTDTLPTDIDKLLKEINQQMSTYVPDSELSRFNRAPANEWFSVSAETMFVTKRALHFFEITDGASDVTVGPLVKLWDFGPGRHRVGAKVQAPTKELIAETRLLTGGKLLEVREEPPALRKKIAKLEVDLSSIAKGYAVDAVAELLAARGFTNYMVEIGGEVRAAGTRTDGKPWRIGIEAPVVNKRGYLHIVALKNKALATSGDYRNFRVIDGLGDGLADGQKISHIIDPKSGRPLPYRGWSVTLLCDTCLEADALATALLVMGEDRGYNWCIKHDIAAMFLIRDNESAKTKLIEKKTPRFEQFVPDKKSHR